MFGLLMTTVFLLALGAFAVWALVRACAAHSGAGTEQTWTSQSAPMPDDMVYGPIHMQQTYPAPGPWATSAPHTRRAGTARRGAAFAAGLAVGAWELHDQRKQVRNERDRRRRVRDRARCDEREREDTRKIQRAQLDYINHLKRTGNYRKGAWWQG